MKWVFKILLILMVYGVQAQQNEMFQQKKERKRLWRKWRPGERKNKTAYNPYLKKKAKDKPSARISRGDKKEIRQQKRIARRQMRKSKRKTGY